MAVKLQVSKEDAAYSTCVRISQAKLSRLTYKAATLHTLTEGKELNMTSSLFTRVFLGVLLVVASFWMSPSKAEAWSSPPWIDKITLVVMEQKNLSKTGNFDPYFKQLDVVSEAAVKETYEGKRKGMNRFLEMLETKEGGISPEAAHRIFAAVVKSVPYAVLLPIKNEDKMDSEEKALFERMKRFAASIRDQDERAALGF